MQAPAMAEPGVFSVSDNDLFDFFPVFSLKNNGGNDDEDCASAKDNNFVFNLDPSLLIDPSCVLIGQALGEGPQAIVYEGLWVPFLALKLSLFAFLLLLGYAFLVRLITLSACS